MISLEKLPKILKQALAMNSQPTEESFPDLPDVLVWFRFLLGCAYGAFLGLKDVRGGVMVLQALNLITFIPVVYCRLYLGTSSDAFGSKVVFSGTFQALALVLLIWIYFFTAAHEDDEAKLTALLIVPPTDDSSSSGEDAMGSEAAGAAQETDGGGPVFLEEESEF